HWTRTRPTSKCSSTKASRNSRRYSSRHGSSPSPPPARPRGPSPPRPRATRPMTDRDRHPEDEMRQPHPADSHLDPALERALDPTEVAAIRRLDEPLAALEHGHPLDLDPSEDPELFALLAAARAVDHSFEATTHTRAFHSFLGRSRNAILHTLEAERPVPFRERLRVVVAAAAGIAAVVISVATLGGPV